VATPAKQIAQSSVQERVLEVCGGLLEELGSHRAFAAVRGEAHLDRDLGLGSLERVELMVRLDAEFIIRLPDRPVAEADTLDDLVAAVQAELAGDSAGSGISDTPVTRLSPEVRIEPGAQAAASGRVEVGTTAAAPIDIARYTHSAAAGEQGIRGAPDAGIEAAAFVAAHMRYQILGL